MLYSCYIIILFVFALCSASRTSSTNLRTREKEILDNLFDPKNYDNRIRPIGVNDTDVNIVYVDLFVLSINSISDVNMDYKIQLYLRQRWNDSRLAFNSNEVSYLTLNDVYTIWKPDLFFSGEKESHFHNMVTPNQMVRIYPSGEVLYSIRISLTLDCQMNLVAFPHDIQDCLLLMESYSYSTDHLALLWKAVDPVKISQTIYLPKFTLETYSTNYCNMKLTTGTYSCLRLTFRFKRMFSYFLLQYYIPCCMLVIVSWISFWLHPGATTARVALGITTLLTMSMEVASRNQSLPPVSYIMAIDVWTGACLTFVFAALLEFAVVSYVSTSEKKETTEQNKKGKKTLPDLEEGPETVDNGASAVEMKPLDSSNSEGMNASPEGEHSRGLKKNFLKIWFSKFPSRGVKIDVVSRIVFPLAFAIFNLAYWCKNF